MATVLHSGDSGGKGWRQFCTLGIPEAKVGDSSAFWTLCKQKLTTVLHSGDPGAMGANPILYDHGAIMVQSWYDLGDDRGYNLLGGETRRSVQKSRISVSKALFAGRARAVLRTSI